MRVLLADADEFAELVQGFLWDCGHEAEVVRDGVECIEVLKEFVPDVVVLDGDLRWGGSEGVVAWLNEHPSLAGTPVIVTADPADVDAGEIRCKSPIALLPKPYRLGQVLNQINAAARFVPADPLPVDAGRADFPTYFVQVCPHCDRWLSIPIQYLGESTRCHYCEAPFVAVQSPDGSFDSIGGRGSPLGSIEKPLPTRRQARNYRPGRN